MQKLNNSKSNHPLSKFGSRGTGDINTQDVNQLCTIWCAKAARPFSALVEVSHWAILHPTVIKSLPGRQKVSRDICMIYSAVQNEYISVLKASINFNQLPKKGAMYLGVDAWQSPNKFNVLGTVIYCLVDSNTGDTNFKAVPLDSIVLLKATQGSTLVVEKFGIQDKICGILSDNASNNKSLASKLKKQKWEHFKGKPQWIQCFSHVLTLIVQGNNG
ncbi:hypothetical protein PTTG_05331 [Puccinia triticina 1-1 BBBD Race 1]|uniref:DUF659 domain-containing protein n=1 Tax=Puccinia triticina (isolate 1-1 / race 1 (BBBD)) TaxID=630390 RepID=A0A0C4EWY4_PUCT1|nr:hypothetical protein PTTG_05331 [Puccinia triticina 1-1 BBBD Race 1]